MYDILGCNETYGFEDSEGPLGKWLVLGHCAMHSGHERGWYNAKVYNPPEHTPYKWAVTMSPVTNAWLQKLPKVAKMSDSNKSHVFNQKVCENILETIMNDKNLQQTLGK